MVIAAVAAVAGRFWRFVGFRRGRCFWLFGGLRLWGLVVGGRRRRDGLARRGRLARDRRRGRLRRARGLDHSDYALAPHDRVGAARGRKRAQGDEAYDPRRETRRRKVPRTDATRGGVTRR